MLLSARHFSLGFRHFSLGWRVCNSLCHNGLREMSFPNRLNNRLKKSIGDYAMLRPYASWKMDWKVVERWIGECVSSLLGNQRYAVPNVSPSRERKGNEKPSIVSVSRTTMEGWVFMLLRKKVRYLSDLSPPRSSHARKPEPVRVQWFVSDSCSYTFPQKR